jgi:hypothetical protein
LPLLYWFSYNNSHYKNWFLESQPKAGIQKTNFGVASAFGAGNTKIGFIMGIVGLAKNCDRNIHDFAYDRKVVKIFLIRKLSYLI